MQFGLVSLLLAALHQFRLAENFFSTILFVPGLLVLHTKYKEAICGCISPGYAYMAQQAALSTGFPSRYHDGGGCTTFYRCTGVCLA